MCIRDRAKEELLKSVEDDVKVDVARLYKELENRAKEDANKKAREYVVNAIQKCAVDHVSETTISVVQLPSDEMKGRIIGREGRNIRTLETLTGVDLIIDDTPEAVVLSAFDPIRREIARVALEKLIVDGRIHPARIEEMVEKAQKEVEAQIREDGENAAMDVGVHGIHPELLKLLGRMKFRSSYEMCIRDRYINTLEGYFCTAGVKVFVLDLAFRITVQGICIIRTEFFYIKVGRSHADLFIRSKSNAERSVRYFFRKDMLQRSEDLCNAGLVVCAQDRGSV